MQPKRRIIILLSVLLGLGLLVSRTSTAQPVEQITILTPGNGSGVTAPIDLTAEIIPGEDGLIRVTLIDRNQTLLARQLLQVNETAQVAVMFSTRLDFEIPGETTAAILTITTQDHLHRPVALRSVTLTLKSSGEDQIILHSIADPWLTITQPQPGAVITASPLIVTGQVTPLNDRPVIFELITERGGSIISKQLAVETPGEMIDFEVPLVYALPSGERDMRLVVRQTTEIGGGDAILDSLPVKIAP